MHERGLVALLRVAQDCRNLQNADSKILREGLWIRMIPRLGVLGVPLKGGLAHHDPTSGKEIDQLASTIGNESRIPEVVKDLGTGLVSC